MMTKYGITIAAAFCLCAPALAVDVPNGTVTFVANFNPIVDYTLSPSTATFNGPTFEISGLGGFGASAGKFGTMNGTVSFSSTPGATIAQSVSNFFSFDDGSGGNYIFSLTSALTQSYNISPANASESFALYLLGSTANTHLGYSPTATSLTVTFNQTAGSGFSASGTLAVPPAPIPEPATWAMFIGGFGLVGGAMRRRTSVAFAG